MPSKCSSSGGPSVCVVGAGVAGLTAARRLKEHGFAVRLFGYCGYRRLAGRLYTETWDLNAHSMDGTRKLIRGKEAPENTIRFDTGCQWLSGQDPRFLAELERWRAKGAVEEWTGAVLGSLTQDGTAAAFEPLAERPSVWCGKGGNATIVESIAEDIGEENIAYHIARRFVRGEQNPIRYVLEYEEALTQNHLDFVGGNLPLHRATRKTTEEFDYVVLAHGLGTNQPRMVSFEDPQAQEVCECLKRNVRWQTMHAVTLAFRQPLPLEFDVCRVPERLGNGLALVVHTSAKPGMRREDGLSPDVWTIFPSTDLAREFAKPKEAKQCQRMITDQFFSLFQLQPFKRQLISQLQCPFGLIWPHGRCTTRPPGDKTKALFSPAARVGVCADYAGGAPCVEAAVVSALELADALKAHAEKQPVLRDTILTDLTRDWEPISKTLSVPWVVAHFPGLPAPPSCPPDSTPAVPVSEACCPTHDPLGAHPGLVFGRTAKLKPWERKQAERGEKVDGLDLSEFMRQRPKRPIANRWGQQPGQQDRHQQPQQHQKGGFGGGGYASTSGGARPSELDGGEEHKPSTKKSARWQQKRKTPGGRGDDTQICCRGCQQQHETFLDVSDGKQYCLPCWRSFQGEAPRQPEQPSSSCHHKSAHADKLWGA